MEKIWDLRYNFLRSPESLNPTYELMNVARKKEIEIEEICNLHYKKFSLAVNKLRAVLVDAEELKSKLT